MRQPFRRRYFRIRLLPAYALAVAGVLLAGTTAGSFAAGSACVSAGLALRAWGAGHLVKNDRLTVSGPYAHLRHPLYAGTLLIAMGLALMLGGALGPLLLALFLAVFFLLYFPNKDRIERARLERLHGEPYARYHAAVPALVPRLRAWRVVAAPGPVPVPRWSPRCYQQNNELGTLVAVGLAVAALGLRAAAPL